MRSAIALCLQSICRRVRPQLVAALEVGASWYIHAFLGTPAAAHGNIRTGLFQVATSVEADETVIALN